VKKTITKATLLNKMFRSLSNDFAVRQSNKRNARAQRAEHVDLRNRHNQICRVTPKIEGKKQLTKQRQAQLMRYSAIPPLYVAVAAPWGNAAAIPSKGWFKNPKLSQNDPKVMNT
jgi:hypothetical protein